MIFQEYKVAHSMEQERLEVKVNALLADGWRLSGGICCDGHFGYFQALYKEYHQHVA